MKINELLTEAPIEMDPSEPMNPLVHSHQGANPGKLQFRMLRAAGQLKDLAKRAEHASPLEWETISKNFSELSVTVTIGYTFKYLYFSNKFSTFNYFTINSPLNSL